MKGNEMKEGKKSRGRQERGDEIKAGEEEWMVRDPLPSLSFYFYSSPFNLTHLPLPLFLCTSSSTSLISCPPSPCSSFLIFFYSSSSPCIFSFLPQKPLSITPPPPPPLFWTPFFSILWLSLPLLLLLPSSTSSSVVGRCQLILGWIIISHFIPISRWQDFPSHYDNQLSIFLSLSLSSFVFLNVTHPFATALIFPPVVLVYSFSPCVLKSFFPVPDSSLSYHPTYHYFIPL